MSKPDHKNRVEEAENKNLPAQAQSTALAVAEFEGHEGEGLESINRNELRIPMLTLLQALSPQVQPVTAGGMVGAKAGMLLNGGTAQLYDIGEKPLTFIACKKDHCFVEWTPRNLGGGFVARHEVGSDLVMQLTGGRQVFGPIDRNVTKRDANGRPMDGTQLVETMSIYGIFDVLDQPFEAILPCKSTQISTYQQWLGRTKGFLYPNSQGVKKPAPIWGHIWDLKSLFHKKGENSWYGYSISLHEKDADGKELPSKESLTTKYPELVERARNFIDILNSGAAKADYDTDRSEGGQAAASDQPPM